MKNFFACLLLVCTVVALPLIAQDRGKSEVSFEGMSVSVDYGRPSLRGRDMIGMLPTNMAWRMGQNDATMLKTESTLHFGSQTVEPGSYRLWARKNDSGQWELMISSSEGNYAPENDVAVVALNTEPQSSEVETLTIELKSTGENQGRFSMSWGTLLVAAEFTVS